MKTGKAERGGIGIQQFLLAVTASVLLVIPSALADRVWTGTNGLWSDPTMWTPNGVPGDSENVTLRAGNYTNYISESSANLQSFTQYGGTLLFTNWTTALRATDVVMATGRMTHALCDTNMVLENTNRVWILATNLTILSNAQINVDAMGFRGGRGGGGAVTNGGQGPGGATFKTWYGSGAASYGGMGGAPYNGDGAPGPVYGDAVYPSWPGSGGAGGGGVGSVGGNGGGAIWLEIASRLTLHGAIMANGGKGNGCGSGGGIFIFCESVVGTGGVIRANGGTLGRNEGAAVGGGGGGGRVAVHYNATAQSGLPKPEIRISALRGCGDSYNNWIPTRNGYPGTVYLKDEQLMQTSLSYPDGGQYVSITNWVIPALTVVSSNHAFSLTLGAPNKADNTWAIFPNLRSLTVSNHMSIHLGARLDLSNSIARIGGDLAMATNSEFYAWAGETNSGTTPYGALVAVTNAILIASNSWIYPVSHWTNGGSVMFQAGSVNIATTNAGFIADGFGYGSHTQYPSIYTNIGYGPGGGGYRSGGGYGGVGSGGYPGKAYGTTNAPLQCGSGGGYQHNGLGQPGGGLVWIEASGAVSISGTIVARGLASGGYDGGGAGGGIFIRCAEFSGTTNAVLFAKGGNGKNAGAGGGGRIAVWYRTVSDDNAQKIKANQMSQVVGTQFITTNYPGFLGMVSSAAGTGGTAGALPGSIVFLAIGRAPGTLMMVR